MNIVNSDNMEYSDLINSLIDMRKDLNEEEKKVLKLLLLDSPNLLIKEYRHYLRFNALGAWEKNKKTDSVEHTNLSSNITEFLKRNPFDEFIGEYESLISHISQITGKSIDYIVYIFQSYSEACRLGDMNRLSSCTGDIKGLIKEFNAKVKEKFIRDYINQRVLDIKPFFKLVTKSTVVGDSQKDKIINFMLKNDALRNSIRKEIDSYFNVILDSDELEEFVKNIINYNSRKNYDMLNIRYSPKFDLLQGTKSFNRLNQNYLEGLRRLFSIDQVDLINQFVNGDSESRKKLYPLFSEGQRRLLLEIIPIMNDFDCSIDVLDSQFVFSANSKILNSIEERAVKDEYKKIDNYDRIVNFIFKNYYLSARSIDDIESDVINSEIDENNVVLFTDDNYSLSDKSFLNKYGECINFVNGIDKAAIDYIMRNKDVFDKLKNLLINEGLLSCFLCDSSSDFNILCNVINNLRYMIKNHSHSDLHISNFSNIVKDCELCKYIDDFTLALLGQNVAGKIVYNQQFLQNGNDPINISTRLRKATDLMIRANDVRNSAVPYFEPIEYEGVKLIRYNNNDPQILTSGIDSNTCFKIDANDNDYLFYSILNKNGCVLYFEEDGKLCGRITAHLKNNCLMINGIRNIDNEYSADSLDKKRRNDKFLKLVEMFADKMIEESSNSNCPIDFVIANKSGILEASDYNDRYQLVENRIFRQYLDVDNDDFSEFSHMYDGKEQFLKQAPYYSGGIDEAFTTDFGHYSLVLIKSRDNKYLERMWDVSITSPDPIYERKNMYDIKKTGKLSDSEKNIVRRIHALNYYFEGGDPKDYTIPSYFDFNFDYVEIKDDYYILDAGDIRFECYIHPLSSKFKEK